MDTSDTVLCWNQGALARQISAAPPAFKDNALSIACCTNGAFARPPGLRYRYRAWPDETHATRYHPAALAALRTMLRPVPLPAPLPHPQAAGCSQLSS